MARQQGWDPRFREILAVEKLWKFISLTRAISLGAIGVSRRKLNECGNELHYALPPHVSRLTYIREIPLPLDDTRVDTQTYDRVSKRNKKPGGLIISSGRGPYTERRGGKIETRVPRCYRGISRK